MTKNTKQKSKTIALIAFTFLFTLEVSFANASVITASKMVELTNGSRSEAGLGALSTNDKLERAAEMKAKDMLINQYFEHTSPQGVTPWYWFEQAGYEYVYAAENLAIDFVTAEGAHKALMESTGHRENILGGTYKEIGIAVVSGEFEGKDTIVIVEEFGSQREHKITINNAAFFETKTTVEEVEEEESAIGQTPAAVVEIKRVEAPITKTLASVETPVTIMDEPEETVEVPAETTISMSGQKDTLETAGKSIPKVYAVRSIQTIKKVYIEDIYWTNADDEGLINSLGRGTAAMRILIRDMTGSILYALL